MHSYFISQSNIITVRTNQICSSDVQLKLQNMYSFENYSASLSSSQYSYDNYNSILSFTASVPTEVAGTQYRAEVLSSGSLVWNGTIEVFTSQSLNKASYTNQIPLEEMYVSKDSNNQFIILE